MVVARAVRTRSPARGARPFDPARDLHPVARLLEEAFRAEHSFPFAQTPILREMGILLWTMSYAPMLPENVSGFVWLEDDHVVGNITLNRDEGRLDRYLISNVAVTPAFRRRGIARALVQIALDHLRAIGAKWALLNVRPNNPGAIKLYRDLGFEELEMCGEWTRPGAHTPVRARGSVGAWAPIRPLRWGDRVALHELLRAVTPPNVQQFRAPRFEEFQLNWEDHFTEKISDFLLGQVTRRWVWTEHQKLAAVLLVRGTYLPLHHRIAIQVEPAFRGRIENDLVAFALRQLERFPAREIRLQASSTHPELIAALEAHGFRLTNGLTSMALALTETRRG